MTSIGPIANMGLQVEVGFELGGEIGKIVGPRMKIGS